MDEFKKHLIKERQQAFDDLQNIKRYVTANLDGDVMAWEAIASSSIKASALLSRMSTITEVLRGLDFV